MLRRGMLSFVEPRKHMRASLAEKAFAEGSIAEVKRAEAGAHTFVSIFHAAGRS